MSLVAPGARDVDLLRAMIDHVDQQDPGAFNNLGVLYHSKGLHPEAVDAFLRALTLDPRMRTAARNLEIAATHAGACDARLASLSARIDADADDIGAHREHAQLLRLIGRHVEARRELDALIAADPDDADALFERGLIEQRAGDLRRAQRWYERAVNAASGDPIPRLHLAEVLYQRGQNEQALDALDQLLTQFPSVADAHLLHGFVLGDMGRHELARESARRAASLNPALQTLQPDLSLDTDALDGPLPAANVHPATPGSAESALARYGLGLAFRQRGYFAEARREFVRSLAMGEDAELAQHAIAELDLVDGQHQAALNAYDALLLDHPEHARYWNERGVALHQGGDVSAAAESYRRALRTDPRFALAYNNLGVALSDLGEASAAREALSRAAALDPTAARVRLNLARWNVRHRDPLAALSLLRELVAFHPSDADAWHDLGLVFQLLHRPDDAREALARAIEARPDHAEARYTLALVLASLGDDDGALRETQRALGLAPVRIEPRLLVVIDLQRECPDAVGLLDLLAVTADAPLNGVALEAADVEALFPEQRAAPEQRADDLLEQAAHLCELADQFASRTLHGEARDRYMAAKALLDRLGAGDGSAATIDTTLARRIAVGEARSRCLQGDGSAALASLRALAAAMPGDAEVLALLAHSAAMAALRGTVATEVAPTLLRRLLRMELRSAALLHFCGDTATAVGHSTLALAFYRCALALDPSRPSPRIAIARVLRHSGDLQAARLELAAALAASPRLRDAVLELARVNLAARRAEESLPSVTGHLRCVPTDLDALLVLVQLLMAVDRDADARVALARLHCYDPAHIGAWWFDGVLLARQSRMREALAQWRRVAAEGESEYAARAANAIVRLDRRNNVLAPARMAS